MSESPTMAAGDAFADSLRMETAAELEADLWHYTRLLREATAPADRAFVLVRLDAVQREIRIRERISDPVAPLRPQAARYDLERIKADIPLTDAVVRLAAVELAKRGNHFAGRCPFPDHHDGTPSFTVSADGQLWRCHGCGRGGDLFSFADQWYATRSFVAAVEIVVTGMGRSLDAYRIDRPRPTSGNQSRVA